MKDKRCIRSFYIDIEEKEEKIMLAFDSIMEFVPAFAFTHLGFLKQIMNESTIPSHES